MDRYGQIARKISITKKAFKFTCDNNAKQCDVTYVMTSCHDKVVMSQIINIHM